MRTRDHPPLTENQKWHSMVQAVRAYISSGEAIAQMDKFSRIRLQNTEGSDSWYSIDRNVLDGYVENDDSTIPAGFRLHEQRARYPEKGTPYIETLLKRPMGNFYPTLSEFYDKTNLLPSAFQSSQDNWCCVHQLQVVLAQERSTVYSQGRRRQKRKHFRPNGVTFCTQ